MTEIVPNCAADADAQSIRCQKPNLQTIATTVSVNSALIIQPMA
jgi:hypothetical protein